MAKHVSARTSTYGARKYEYFTMCIQLIQMKIIFFYAAVAVKLPLCIYRLHELFVGGILRFKPSVNTQAPNQPAQNVLTPNCWFEQTIFTVHRNT